MGLRMRVEITHREWIPTGLHDGQASLLGAMELLTVLMKVGTPATEFPVKASSLRAQVTALNGVRKQIRVMLVTSQLLAVTFLVRTALGMMK